MKRIFLAFLCLLFANEVCFALGGISGSYSACSNFQLPRDANGWAIFTSPTTGTIYYISQNDGNDSNNGTSSVPNPLNTGGAGAAGPWKTIAKAVTQAATDAGKDSWFLFKKGDTFTDQGIGSVNANGKDCLHPMLWSSYDPGQPAVPDPYGNVAVASISCTGTTTTVTTATPHGWTNGNPYQLVLTKELPAGFNGEFAATITGISTFTFAVSSCPAASDTTHGIVTLGRPLFKVKPVTSPTCLFNAAGSAVQDFFAAVGIHCWAYTVDPYSASFSKTDFQSAMGANTVTASANLSPHFWRLYEDNQFTAMVSGINDNPAEGGNPGINFYLGFYRNIFYHTFGQYVDGAQNLDIVENVSTIEDWDPVFSASQSVSITTGTPGVVTQSANNFYISGTICSQVQFTATSMPTGLSAGVTYFAANVSGNTFNVDTTDCTGAHLVAISTAGSGVVAYWLGSTGTGCGFPCNYPQVSVFEHAWYLQVAQYQGQTWYMNIRGNTIGLISGTACECGNAGTAFNNLFFQTSANLIQGKGNPPAWITALHWDATYNGFFELAPEYLTPTARVVLNGQGDSYSSQTGTVNFAHNLLAYETPLNASNGTGVTNGFRGLSGFTSSNNVACGINTPISNRNGAIITASVSAAGSGYTPISSATQYQGYSPTLIPFTGGSGTAASGTVTVTSGAVSSVTVVQGNTGPGFKVGDVLGVDPSYVGGTGSGAAFHVDSIDAAGHITGLSVSAGGTGYSSAYGNIAISTTSGAGSGDLYQVAVAANGTVTGIYAEFGNSAGFAVNDTFTFAAASIGGTGSGMQGKVTAITSNPQVSNTTQAANCNSLPGGSATPPTDVIGSYFATLPYGFTLAVPGILSGQASGGEMGFVYAQSLMQKANWDTALMAAAVLNWARPQFGIANP